jgi:hypothetical protein
MPIKINIPLSTLVSCNRTYCIAVKTIKVLRAALILSVLIVLFTYQIIDTAPLGRPWLPLLVLSTKDGPSHTSGTTCSNAVPTLRAPTSVSLRHLLGRVVRSRFSSTFRWSDVSVLIIAHVISVEEWLDTLAPRRCVRIIG